MPKRANNRTKQVETIAAEESIPRSVSSEVGLLGAAGASVGSSPSIVGTGASVGPVPSVGAGPAVGSTPLVVGAGFGAVLGMTVGGGVLTVGATVGASVGGSTGPVSVVHKLPLVLSSDPQ